MNFRRKIWFILALTFLAVLIDLPKKIDLNFSLGKIKVNQTITRPAIDFNVFGRKINRELDIRRGLDLAGGTHLALEAEMGGIEPQDRERALEATKEIIERRVNLFGVSEPIVQTAESAGSYRVLVELPGINDLSEALALIGKTAQLVFREEEATPSSKVSSEAASLYGPFQKQSGLTGKHLRRSDIKFDQNTGKVQVGLEFNEEGSKLFEEITKRNIDKPVAIFLDNELISAPKVNETITGGNAVITGEFSVEEAKQMSIALNAGALPVGVKIIEQRTIGATLGEESIKKSIVAGGIGLLVVAIFMIVSYGIKGLAADLGLIIYTLLVLAFIKLIPVTLTLAGIAGFILSIGMAVDANILIFERVKEELYWGKPKNIATELGFSRAWASIRDSNVSSLITCAILYWFGTGLIRGFALTLALGIAVSLFTAITVTKTFLRIIYR